MGVNPTITITAPSQKMVDAVEHFLEMGRKRKRRGYPAVGWDLETVDPCGQNYVNSDCTLITTCVQPGNASTPFILAVRMLNSSGHLQTNAYSYTPNIAGGRTTFTQDLTEGFLLSVTLQTNTGSPVQPGNLFVMVSLAQNKLSGTPLYRTLISDYATSINNPGWPDGVLHNFRDSPGLISTGQFAVPGVGADWTFNTVANTITRIIAIGATLTTSATVANRTPVLTIQDPQTRNLWIFGSPAAQAASKVLSYNWGAGCPLGTDIGGNFVMPLPESLLIESVGTASVTTGGLQAADQWSNVVGVTESWPVL